MRITKVLGLLISATTSVFFFRYALLDAFAARYQVPGAEHSRQLDFAGAVLCALIFVTIAVSLALDIRRDTKS